MANKTLVIVESPSKAKTIGKYLGSEYLVKSSVGHIRRLASGKKAIDPKDWTVSYEIDPKKTKVVQDLVTYGREMGGNEKPRPGVVLKEATLEEYTGDMNTHLAAKDIAKL